MAFRSWSTALSNVVLSFSLFSFARTGFNSYASICFCSFSASAVQEESTGASGATAQNIFLRFGDA